MKIMSNQGNTESANTAGSSVDDLINGPGEVDFAAGEPQENEINEDEFVKKEQYEELEKKLGAQGNELGEYRNALEELSPIMQGLENRDDLVQAIVDEKITPELLDSILAGKVSVSDTKDIVEANKEVKKDIGKKEYAKMNSEEIEKLISEKVEKMVEEKSSILDTKIIETDERRLFEKNVEEFISDTTDFTEYSEEISKFFEENPSQSDIKIAYDVVKGRALATLASKNSNIDAAEVAKRLAGNAGDGKSQGGTIEKETNVLDSLISPNMDPNSF